MLTQNMLQVMKNEDSFIIVIIHLNSSIDREDGIISSEVLDVFVVCVLASHDHLIT